MIMFPLCPIPALRRLGPLILQRPRDLHAQLIGRMQRPIRIAQQFASEEDHVGQTGRHDLLGLFRHGDQADGSDGDTQLLPDGGGEGV